MNFTKALRLCPCFQRHVIRFIDTCCACCVIMRKQKQTRACMTDPVCARLIIQASYHESLFAWKPQPQICLGIHLAITYNLHNPSLHQLPLAISIMHNCLASIPFTSRLVHAASGTSCRCQFEPVLFNISIMNSFLTPWLAGICCLCLASIGCDLTSLQVCLMHGMMYICKCVCKSA